MDEPKIDMRRSGQYTYKGIEYGSLGDCKLKLDGDWVDAVVYCKEGRLYVRLVKDFDSKFVEIPYVITPVKPKKG